MSSGKFIIGGIFIAAAVVGSIPLFFMIIKDGEQLNWANIVNINNKHEYFQKFLVFLIFLGNITVLL